MGLFRFLRGLWRRQDDDAVEGCSNAPKPLVELEGVERPPDDLLRRLREIDPRLELLGVGNGIWWLGRVVWTRDRHRIAANILKTTHVNDRNRWIRLNAKLGLRGFGFVSDWQGEPTSRILLDYQRRDWKFRNGVADAEFDERMLYSDGTMEMNHRLDVLRDKTHSDKNAIFNYQMRRQRHFAQRQRTG